MRERLLASRLALCTHLQSDPLQGGTKGRIKPFKLVINPGITFII